MKGISLFSGMGGDSLGMKNAGVELIGYSEIEKEFQKTHDKNFPNCKLIGNGDVVKTTDEEFEEFNEADIIFAGFPCQGFSQAGKKLPDDPRNTLFREFLRATSIIKPKFIIGENVKGLLKRRTVDGTLYIDIIKDSFDKIDYKIVTKVMKCSEYGIPQNRIRLIIVGIRKDINQTYTFPQETHEPVDLKDIIKFSMDGSICIDDEDFDISSVPPECIITDTTNTEKPGKCHPYLSSLAKDRDYVRKGESFPIRLHFGKRIPVGGQVIDINKPLNTVICTYARQPRFFVPLRNQHGFHIRTLLPDELKQIQGFPSNYVVCGNPTKQIIQIGNAVPPPLIEKVVRQLFI
jgi:DNA (cytosine-5)-methyltransferase 1